MLPDEKMRAHLESDHSLIFTGLSKNWQEVEKQVERLGFGEKYFVSRVQGVHGDHTKVAPARKQPPAPGARSISRRI